jgi:DNA-binding GntR family transcriptional regulator
MDAPMTRPGLGRERARTLARTMERDIGLGHLAPGEWLKQVDLEARYGATRMEVRQALDRLVEKGLVKHLARRGYRVEDFDPERQAQIMEVRAVLEAAAAYQVIGLLDEATLAAMEVQAERFRANVLDGTVEEQEEANLEFHRLMLAPCPNRELVALLFDLRGRVPVAVTRRRNTVGLLQRAAEHHFEIIRLVRARDATGLARLMRVHNLTPKAPDVG